MILYIEEKKRSWRIVLVLMLTFVGLASAMSWIGQQGENSEALLPAETPTSRNSDLDAKEQPSLPATRLLSTSGEPQDWKTDLDLDSPSRVISAWQKYAVRAGYNGKTWNELSEVMERHPVRVRPDSSLIRVLGAEVDGWMLELGRSRDPLLQTLAFQSTYVGSRIESTFHQKGESVLPLKEHPAFRDVTAFIFLCEAEVCAGLRTFAFHNAELYRDVALRTWSLANQCGVVPSEQDLAHIEATLRAAARMQAGVLATVLEGGHVPVSPQELESLRQEVQTWAQQPSDCRLRT